MWYKSNCTAFRESRDGRLFVILGSPRYCAACKALDALRRVPDRRVHRVLASGEAGKEARWREAATDTYSFSIA